MFRFVVLLFLLFSKATCFSQFVSLETCNEASNISARNTCFKSYIESLLLNEFNKNKRSKKSANRTDKLTLEIFVNEDGNFEILKLEVKNTGLYMATKRAIEKLLPISSYKNFQGEILLDIIEIEINFPLKEETPINKKAEVSLQNVEQSPIFPGCYSDDNKDLKACMSQNIKTHIANNFNVFVKANTRIPKGNQRINIQFTINKDGYVKNIKAKAKYKELEQEAVRAIKALPKMTPGKIGNEAVDVSLILPITFNLQ